MGVAAWSIEAKDPRRGEEANAGWSARGATGSALWTVAGFCACQGVRFFGNIWLAKLLFPEAFGLMALVGAVMQGLQMMTDIGIGPGIIRSPRGEDAVFLRTAWTIQIVRGIGLSAFGCMLAGPLALVFWPDDPAGARLGELLPVVGGTAFLNGLVSTSVWTLNRRLQMGWLTVLEISAQVVSTVVMVVLAKLNPSVWALVFGGVAYAMVRVVVSHCLNTGHRDGLGWNWEAARELGQFGGWIFASSVLVFVAGQADRPILARWMSMSELGVYSLALTFVGMGMEVVGRVSNLVVFPILAQDRGDPGLLVEKGQILRSGLLWVGGAMCVSLVIGAPLFFGRFYDARYLEAGRVSQWLSLVVWVWILRATMDRIPLVLGRTRDLFYGNVINLVGVPAGLLGFWRFGIAGWAVGIASGSFLAHGYLCLRLPHGGVGLLWQSCRFSLGWLGYLVGVLWLRGGVVEWKGWLWLGLTPLLLVGGWLVRERRWRRMG